MKKLFSIFLCLFFCVEARGKIVPITLTWSFDYSKPGLIIPMHWYFGITPCSPNPSNCLTDQNGVTYEVLYDAPLDPTLASQYTNFSGIVGVDDVLFPPGHQYMFFFLGCNVAMSCGSIWKRFYTLVPTVIGTGTIQGQASMVVILGQQKKKKKSKSKH